MKKGTIHVHTFLSVLRTYRDVWWSASYVERPAPGSARGHGQVGRKVGILDVHVPRRRPRDPTQTAVPMVPRQRLRWRGAWSWERPACRRGRRRRPRPLPPRSGPAERDGRKRRRPPRPATSVGRQRDQDGAERARPATPGTGKRGVVSVPCDAAKLVAALVDGQRRGRRGTPARAQVPLHPHRGVPRDRPVRRRDPRRPGSAPTPRRPPVTPTRRRTTRPTTPPACR